jgi:hypothetical protein
MTVIYTKILVLANSRALEDIFNLMSVDATQLQDSYTWTFMAISGPQLKLSTFYTTSLVTHVFFEIQISPMTSTLFMIVSDFLLLTYMYVCNSLLLTGNIKTMVHTTCLRDRPYITVPHMRCRYRTSISRTPHLTVTTAKIRKADQLRTDIRSCQSDRGCQFPDDPNNSIS